MRCPVHRRFFLIRRSSIDGSPVRSSMSLFVSLCPSRLSSCSHERRCCIMKSCSFFTCRLHSVQASAPYRKYIYMCLCGASLSSGSHDSCLISTSFDVFQLAVRSKSSHDALQPAFVTTVTSTVRL